MENALQRNIKKYLEDNNLTASALERKAGLKQSAVQNILYGRSKKPSVAVISAIARELGCTVEDLIGSSDEEGVPYPRAQDAEGDVSIHTKKTVWDYKLFLASVGAVQKLIEKYRHQPWKEQVVSLVDDIYQYSQKGASKEVDYRFAEWLIEKKLGGKAK